MAIRHSDQRQKRLITISESTSELKHEDAVERRRRWWQREMRTIVREIRQEVTDGSVEFAVEDEAFFSFLR